ncbi:hypothetical protein E3N88_17471 [Mikania micrantha]|uniref:Chromo domain-containing protein n=1 Tax=Mikania micrantha TaxID=192012 RepID=A0A5N6NU76_9ASTR|nr:hypothetical protein E3N88_17471 [Mikania micrantha]
MKKPDSNKATGRRAHGLRAQTRRRGRRAVQGEKGSRSTAARRWTTAAVEGGKEVVTVEEAVDRSFSLQNRSNRHPKQQPHKPPIEIPSSCYRVAPPLHQSASYNKPSLHNSSLHGYDIRFDPVCFREMPPRRQGRRNAGGAGAADAELVARINQTVNNLLPTIIDAVQLVRITNEKVAIAREKLKEAQTRQKSYADQHRRDLEFKVGEHVFLKVSPCRGVRRFGIKGKLSPRFISPFEILERVGEVSYRLALPPQLSHVHNVFHVSLLRGYNYHPLHIVSYPLHMIQEDLSYEEEPEAIIDRQERVMRRKSIPFVKVLWKNHTEREATWETEEMIRSHFSLQNRSNRHPKQQPHKPPIEIPSSCYRVAPPLHQSASYNKPSLHNSSLHGYDIRFDPVCFREMPPRRQGRRNAGGAGAADAELVARINQTVNNLLPTIIDAVQLVRITNEKVAIAREKLKEAQTRQKSYADQHRRDLEFKVGEHVFLKVSPCRGVRRFGIKGKLSPRFISPFEILERVGEVSYRLALPPQLSHVHNVFHVSLLRGYNYHPLHIVSYPLHMIQEDLSYEEEPEAIIDRQERVMRRKSIPFVKVLWKNHTEREATWETEEMIRSHFSLQNRSNRHPKQQPHKPPIEIPSSCYRVAPPLHQSASYNKPSLHNSSLHGYDIRFDPVCFRELTSSPPRRNPKIPVPEIQIRSPPNSSSLIITLRKLLTKTQSSGEFGTINAYAKSKVPLSRWRTVIRTKSGLNRSISSLLREAGGDTKVDGLNVPTVSAMDRFIGRWNQRFC